MLDFIRGAKFFEISNFRSKFQVFRFYIHLLGWDRFYVGIQIEIVIRSDNKLISGIDTKLN